MHYVTTLKAKDNLLIRINSIRMAIYLIEIKRLKRQGLRVNRESQLIMAHNKIYQGQINTRILLKKLDRTLKTLCQLLIQGRKPIQ
jgi:hypothetical protein